MDAMTVGQVAELAHVSVRTLHHYDEIGLVRPSSRSAAGYRLYTEADLARLREVLFWRELEFGLDEITAILTQPGRAADQRLREQHRLLRERLARTQGLIAALDKEMEARDMGVSLTPEEQFEVFGENASKVFADGEYAVEAKQRWGETEAWQESNRRTAAYTKQDWIEIKAEADANIAAFAAALRAGEPVDSLTVMDLAEAHRQHLSRWFYDCGYPMHRGLADMYVSDPRFTATYDEIEPGLSHYVHDGIHANADRH